MKKQILFQLFFLATIGVFAQGFEAEPNTNIKVLSGTILNVAGGDLTLKSDSTGDATLIACDTGAVKISSGKAVVQRYLPGTAGAWHMVSSPVNRMAILGSDWAPGSNDDFYLYLDPSPGTWVNYKNHSTKTTFFEANGSDKLVGGRGYLVAYNKTNPTNNFESSSLKIGQVNINLSKSTTKSWTWTAGWNLVGNPYSSGLDWSKVHKDGIVTEDAAQVYDANKDGGEGYVIINSILASGQGFFVQAKNDGVQLQLAPEYQVHTNTFTQGYFKQGAATDVLTLRLSSKDYYDETKILIHENSIPEHDFYDVTKLFSYSALVPQIYSHASDGWELAVNAIGGISENMVIPIGIKVKGSNVMSIELTEAEGEFDGPEIILHDLLTDIQHKLSEMPRYNFIADEEDEPNRFLLKFGSVGIEDIVDNKGLNVYKHDDRLYIMNSEAATVQVDIYNVRGQLILSKEIGQGLQSLKLNAPPGAYVVELRTEEAICTRKIMHN